MQRLQQKVDEGQAKMEALQAELASLPEEIAKEQAWLAILEERAAQPERHPNQQLGRARRRLPKLQKRQVDINQRMPKLDKDQQFRQEHLQEQIALEQELCERCRALNKIISQMFAQLMQSSVWMPDLARGREWLYRLRWAMKSLRSPTAIG